MSLQADTMPFTTMWYEIKIHLQIFHLTKKDNITRSKRNLGNAVIKLRLHAIFINDKHVLFTQEILYQIPYL